MYSNSLGVPQDYARAVGWWRKAAEQGYVKAQYILGLTYSEGLGVPQAFAQAYIWFNLAACRHPPSEKRDNAVSNRDKVAKKATPAQISEAEKLAQEWKPK